VLEELFKSYLVIFSDSQNVTESRIGGTMRAKDELETAPTRDMNRSSLGIAAARPNVKMTRQ